MANAKMIEMNIPQQAYRCAPPLPQAGAWVRTTVDEFGNRCTAMDIRTKEAAVAALSAGVEAVAEEFELPPMELLRAVRLVIRQDLRMERLSTRTAESICERLEAL